MENDTVVPQKKLHIGWPYDPAIPLPGIHSNKLKPGTLRAIFVPMFAAASFVTAKYVETTQMSINNRWMDKQNMVYTYSGLLFCLEKEGSSDMLQHGWNLRTLS